MKKNDLENMDFQVLPKELFNLSVLLYDRIRQNVKDFKSLLRSVLHVDKQDVPKEGTEYHDSKDKNYKSCCNICFEIAEVAIEAGLFFFFQ